MLKFHCRLLVLSALLATAAQAADLALSTVPLSLRTTVAPNIMLTLDDSRSMRWENIIPPSTVRLNRNDDRSRLNGWNNLFKFMFPRTGPRSWWGGTMPPHGAVNSVAFGRANFYNYFGRNARYNPMFYNPDITYSPWYHPEGIFVNADPTAAYHDIAYPYPTGGAANPRPILRPGAAETIDLTAKQLGNPPDLSDPPTAGWIKILGGWAGNVGADAAHTAERHSRTNVLVNHDIGCDYSYRNYGSTSYDHNDYDHHTHGPTDLPYHDRSDTNRSHGGNHGHLSEGLPEEAIIPNPSNNRNLHTVAAHEHGSNVGAGDHKGDHHHNHDYWPITYYTFHGNPKSNSAWQSRSNYKCVSITTSTLNNAMFTSPNGTTRTKAEEIQNFANWYQYYRTRLATAKAAIGGSLSEIDEAGIRLGYAEFDVPNQTEVDGINDIATRSVIRGVRPFTGTDRTEFFNLLYAPTVSIGKTLTREAVRNVGEYFKRTDDQGPWSSTPGEAGGDTPHSSCRRSYNVVVGDGIWNDNGGGGLTYGTSVGNVDGTAGTLGDGTPYPPVSPFADTDSNTLADVAMKYWREDLRPNLPNDIPATSTDPATWQHMTNSFIGFGLRTSPNLEADLAESLADLQAGLPSTFSWEKTATNRGKADNIAHAVLNSSGSYFSANDLSSLTTAFRIAISEATNTESAASSLGLNTENNGIIYKALFYSADWTGQLLALPTAGGSPLWDAADKIPAANERVIITHDGTEGQLFRWADISSAQQGLLGSEDVLNYLRGDQSKEQSNDGSFRNRTSLLGDIIHSSPVYVGAPSATYPDNMEPGYSYNKFKNDNKDRTPMIYVGANDGFLHGFNADTGEEVFAYAPSALMGKLPLLTDPSYTDNHQYFVDETPIVVDVFWRHSWLSNTGSWRSVLVSGLRGGGQGMFVLDVTDPNAFKTEADAKSKVLLDITDEDDKELGFTYGEPAIVRLKVPFYNRIAWFAEFGGGYNNTVDNDGNGDQDDSTTGTTYIFATFLSSSGSADVIKIAVDRDEVMQGQESSGPIRMNNGLSSPSVATDVVGNFEAKYAYAGDLFGNVWRSLDFDSTKIYTACADAVCTATNRQPITTQIQVVQHPNGGHLLLFGTGKYIETDDIRTDGQTTQSFYALWDRNPGGMPTFSRDDLLEQKITGEAGGYRTTTAEQVDWTTDQGWYIDLESPAGDNRGERQVSTAVISDNTVVFSTITPAENVCAGGGTSWLMALDVFSGSRPAVAAQIVDADGVGIVKVGSEGEVPVSGKKSTAIIHGTPIVAVDGDTKTILGIGSDGSIDRLILHDTTNADGLRSWQQLDF